MTFLALRRRFVVVLVPIVNVVFLALFIFSPESLPRLPRQFSLLPRPAPALDPVEDPIEYISFHSQTDPPAPQPGPASTYNHLIEQRRLVEHVHLTPLPPHLITTYRPSAVDLRPETHPDPHHRQHAFDAYTDNVQEDMDRKLDPSINYLTFLPHSGFHNQRTELENALLLARLLNRTLLMPKVYLGPPMPWLTFPQLHSRLLYQTKIGLDHCRAIIENQEQDPSPQSARPVLEQEREQEHEQEREQEELVTKETKIEDIGTTWRDFEALSPGLPALEVMLDTENSSTSAPTENPELIETDTGEAVEAVDEQEEIMPSWIEESETEDQEERIATGDSMDIMDLEEESAEDSAEDEVEDWEAVEEDEEGEDYEYGEARVGIVEEEEPVPESFELPERHHHHHHRQRHRQLAQQIEMEMEASIPLYLPLENDMSTDPGTSTNNDPPKNIVRRKRSLPETPSPNNRRPQWKPLPAECLQYESWTMTDWDMFFDLDPLRRQVRILTRESIAMTYFEREFNLQIPKEPELPPSPLGTNGTSASSENQGADQESDSEGGSDEKESEEGSSEGASEDALKEPAPLLRTEGDILFFDDTSLYDYRFTEDPEAEESVKTRSKYGQEFTIEWLSKRPERLIHLGSIFGTGRVSISSLESKAWLIMIRDHLILRTEILQSTSQRIVDKITGQIAKDDPLQDGRPPAALGAYADPMEAGFVGVHIRMSDGHFSLTARDTIENIRKELVWQAGLSEESATSDQDSRNVDMDLLLDQHRQQPMNDHHQQQPQTPLSKKHQRLSIEQCRARALNHRRLLEQDLPETESRPRRRSNGRFTPIYLATDAHKPRSNPIFDRLFSTFDCIFTLDDFSEDLEALHQFRNPEDGTLMAKFLIPMVDAMVVAKSAAFFGTPASTFSNYIQKQLRPAYTGLYD